MGDLVTLKIYRFYNTQMSHYNNCYVLEEIVILSRFSQPCFKARASYLHKPLLQTQRGDWIIEPMQSLNTSRCAPWCEIWLLRCSCLLPAHASRLSPSAAIILPLLTAALIGLNALLYNMTSLPLESWFQNMRNQNKGNFTSILKVNIYYYVHYLSCVTFCCVFIMPH